MVGTTLCIQAHSPAGRGEHHSVIKSKLLPFFDPRVRFPSFLFLSLDARSQHDEAVLHDVFAPPPASSPSQIPISVECILQTSTVSLKPSLLKTRSRSRGTQIELSTADVRLEKRIIKSGYVTHLRPCQFYRASHPQSWLSTIYRILLIHRIPRLQ